MTAMSVDSPNLVTGGNVRGSANVTPGRATMKVREEIITWLLLLGGVGAVLTTVIMSSFLEHGARKMTVHAQATTTTFLTTWHMTPPPPVPHVAVYLLVGGFAAILAAIIIRQIIFRESTYAFLRFMLTNLLGVVTLALIVSVLFTIILGVTVGTGTAKLAEKQGAQMRAAASSWIAQNLNLNQSGYEVKTATDANPHTTYLRNLNPDGSLKNVYALTTTGTSISLKPVG